MSKQKHKFSEDAIQITHRIAGATDLLKLHREELATLRAMVTDVVVDAETAPWKRSMIEACDGQLAQLDAALSALGPKESPKTVYVCDKCGGTNVEVLNWCDANSDEITDSAEGDDDVFCNDCEDHTGIVPASEFDPDECVMCADGVGHGGVCRDRREQIARAQRDNSERDE